MGHNGETLGVRLDEKQLDTILYALAMLQGEIAGSVEMSELDDLWDLSNMMRIAHNAVVQVNAS